MEESTKPVLNFASAFEKHGSKFLGPFGDDHSVAIRWGIWSDTPGKCNRTNGRSCRHSTVQLQVKGACRDDWVGEQTHGVKNQNTLWQTGWERVI